MLTRCPHCTTTFRVKPEQLKARLGRVRCGECKTVFNALDSLVEEAPPMPVAAEVPEVSTPLHVASDTVDIASNHPASEPQDEPADEAPAAAPSEDIEPAASEESVEAPAATAITEPEPAASSTDTTVAEAEASEPESIAIAAHEVAEQEAALAASLQQEPVIELAPAEDAQPLPEAEPAAEEPAAESPAEPPLEAASASPAETEAKVEDLDFTLTDAVEIPVAAVAPVAAESAIAEIEAPSLASAVTEAALSPAAADHEPLLHHAQRTARRWPWVALAVLASLLLAGQALFLYRVEVAVAAPALKPLLKTACELAGCDVPRPRKSEMLDIESSDLHPGKQKGRLELVAVLKNKAPFAQEWPVLEVSLTDVADKALIVKSLQPADYLPAGRKPTAGFPAKAEINVNLTLDAGDTPASGYRLYLYYP